MVLEGADHGLGKSDGIMRLKHPGNPFWAHLGGLHSLLFFSAYLNGSEEAKAALQADNAIPGQTQYGWKRS